MNMLGPEKLALAIQKPNGESDPNMGDESVALLKTGGLKFAFKPRVDDAPTNIPGLDIVKMRNGDLVKAVCQGEVDLVIAGSDMYKEYSGQPKAILLNALGFSYCTLKLGIKKDFDFQDPRSLAGLRVATSYPNVTAEFFGKTGWNTDVNINPYLGGEEGVVKRGNAEACVVISDTGNSFEANGLKPAWIVLESQALLIANSRLSEKRGSEQIVWRALRAIMTGIWKTQYTMIEANFKIPLTNEALETLPALESPTVSSLQSGGQAIRSLVPIRNLEESLNRLYAAGASEVVTLEVKSVYPNLNDPEVTRMMRAIYGNNWHLPYPPYSV